MLNKGMPRKLTRPQLEEANEEVTFNNSIEEEEDVDPFLIKDPTGGATRTYGQGGEARSSADVASVIPFEAAKRSLHTSSNRPARTMRAEASFVITVVGLLTKIEKFT